MKLNKLFFIALLGIALGACNNSSTNSSIQKLNASQFQNQLNSNSSKLLLDVRTPEEYEVNHIKNSNNLNIYDEKLFNSSVETLDKDIPVYVYCKSGSRSTTAANTLAQLGFTQIYELEGGIQSWTSSGLPIEEAKKKSKAQHYTLEEYNQFIAEHDLVLVDFMAEWCGPCKAMAPTIDKIKNANEEKLTVLKIDTDINRELSEHFQIFSIPTVKVYHKGELKHDKVGGQSEVMLMDMLGPYL